MNAPIQWATPALLDQRKSIQQQLLDRVLGNLAELDRQLAATKNLPAFARGRRMVRGACVSR